MRGGVLARWLALVLTAAVLLLVPSPWLSSVEAQAGWVIERFEADIQVERNGTLTITEAIDVDFRSLGRRGIFREIPVRYAWGDGLERIYDFRVISVTNAQGRDWRYQVETNGVNRRVRIGDPDVTLTGKQTYRLRYSVAGVLNPFPTHDELYWNVTGNEWEATIQQGGASVRLFAAGLGEAACYQGPRGSTATCSYQPGAEQIIYQATRALPPGEGFTIVAAIRKGLIEPAPAPILVERVDPLRVFLQSILPTWFTGTIAFLIAVGGVGVIGSSWWRNGRDQRYVATPMPGDAAGPAETAPLFGGSQVVVEYEPPERLRPAELGVLVDQRADPRDVTATIIDLAVRGFLEISEVESGGLSGLFGGKDWELKRTDQATSTLKDWERTIHTGLFRKGETVKLSELKQVFYADLQLAQRKLYASATKRGWFSRDPDKARGTWAGIGSTLFFLAVFGCIGGTVMVAVLAEELPEWLPALIGGFPLVLAALALVGLVALVASRAMPARTAKGSELTRRALGFRMYIDTAEKHRQDFNEKAHIFAEYLPYAIVFGLVSRWAKAFEGIDTEPYTRSWYHGRTPFMVTSFASSMDSFSSSVSSTITSTPGSSGGSGFSGGSSGGGGGGGGGGSW